MTRERILATRPDGGVSITIPSEMGILYLMHGPTGPWHPWFGEGWWFAIRQWRSQVKRGVPAKAAWVYAQTMLKGGVTRREAVEIIAARDSRGAAIEIVDVSEIPDDRTYRDAWRRSANGGPIWIDDAIKDRIEEERMWRAYAESA